MHDPRAALVRWRDHRALLLGEGGVQMQQERLDVGTEIGDQKRRLVRHQAGNEMHVAREPVELGDGNGARLPVAAGAGRRSLRKASIRRRAVDLRLDDRKLGIP